MKLLLSFIFVLAAASLSVARDSPFTRQGAGPRYWIAYEYCWVNDRAIPESQWKANIDWMDTTLKSYGYDMICNDGWIETAQTINANGYITKYNDDWEGTFGDWAKYLAARNMKMGIYYNPMWMTKAAYDKNVTVGGTKVKAQDIAGSISFNEPLYWVDVDKRGAKEWIQGYVKYFIATGATFLRIDFLENYEKNYGTAKYIRALEWIREAAGNELFLSLVMPNCFDHAKNELPHGDMMRIDDDCFGGEWDFVSNRRRGQQKALWPQYGNAFDGFIGFADVGGRGQMILDGDFMRLNTMDNDRERMFLFSLMVMGGSALAVADQHNTIGQSVWIYQNTELLALNAQGFVGKPLSHDPAAVNKSSTWAGQLPNGDWVVGLFNREATPQTRSIDFERELGIAGGRVANARDLWAHADLGSLYGGYSVALAPHECKIIKITNNAPKYEAEFASMIGGAKPAAAGFNYSAAGYAENLVHPGAKILFAVEVPSKGEYTLQVRYAGAAPNNTPGTATLYINNRKAAEPLTFPPLSEANAWGFVDTKITLEAGVNFVAVERDERDNGYFNLDYIVVR